MEQESIFNNNMISVTMVISVWIFGRYIDREGEKSDERKINEDYNKKESIIKFLLINIHVDYIWKFCM